MKKAFITIGVLLAGLVGWLFYERPEPPFGGDVPNPSPSQEPTYFAEIAPDGTVLRVIVISQEMLNTGRWGDPKKWVQTWMGGGIRKNYASPGYKYDSSLDVFIPLKPHDSWILDETTAKWKASIDQPVDGKIYRWDESLQVWVEKIGL